MPFDTPQRSGPEACERTDRGRKRGSVRAEKDFPDGLIDASDVSCESQIPLRFPRSGQVSDGLGTLLDILIQIQLRAVWPEVSSQSGCAF